MFKKFYIILSIIVVCFLVPHNLFSDDVGFPFELNPQVTSSSNDIIFVAELPTTVIYSVNYQFDYDYSSPVYDTVPQALWHNWIGPYYTTAAQFGASDELEIVRLDAANMVDASETCDGWGGWENCLASWYMDIHPLRYDEECEGKSGFDKLWCQHTAFYYNNVPEDYGDDNYRRVRFSGPSVGSNLAEWFVTGSEFKVVWDDEINKKRSYRVGDQYIKYNNFIIWDWNDWCWPGVGCADAVWVDFWESDYPPLGLPHDWIINNELATEKGVDTHYNEVVHLEVWFKNSDHDNDGVIDIDDNCMSAFNPNQEDFDNDGNGDACDGDIDDDGVPNNADNCQAVSNPNQVNTDGDSSGDACDSDDDNDGLSDSEESQLGTDPAKADTDEDGLNDHEEVQIGTNPTKEDTDEDGLNDYEEHSVYGTNPLKKDTDGDGIDDFKEIELGLNPLMSDNPAVMIIINYLLDDDSDGDGIDDAADNCPSVPNPNQDDYDGDGVGDACDEDIDGDGIDDNADNCPDVVNADQNDLDEDGIGDLCDPIPLGDVTGDGALNDDDIECIVAIILEREDGDGIPGCSMDKAEAADLNCDGSVDVVDVQVAVILKMNCVPDGCPPGVFVESIDFNQNNIPDACE